MKLFVSRVSLLRQMPATRASAHHIHMAANHAELKFNILLVAVAVESLSQHRRHSKRQHKEGEQTLLVQIRHTHVSRNLATLATSKTQFAQCHASY
jgi:hypothetical protein